MAHPTSGAVLVVDDEPLVLRTCAEILRRAGFDVQTAANGEEALARLAMPWDAIVSDINMPGLDGLSLLRQVRRRDLDVQVILITGEPSVETAIRAVEYGALRYLTKPLSTASFARTVADAVTLSRLARTKREALAVLGDDDLRFGDLASLEAAFDDALPRFQVVYQPIVSWRSRRLWAYEALVRSDDDRLSRPKLIITAAERLDRVHALGRRVRAQVARDLERVELPADLRVFVNLHPADLLDPELGTTADPLAAWAARLVLEVTERKPLPADPAVRAALGRLRHAGYRVAVDDMGAGHAGLATFALLEPEVLKIDMSLIRGVDGSAINQRVVKSLLELAGDLRIDEVVVEGIETAPERDTAAWLGADLMQGFLFGHPAAPFTRPVGLGDKGGHGRG